MLADLSKGLWLEDTDHLDGEPWPDEYQSTDKSELVQIIASFADEGKPRSRRHVNALEDGIWEFKRGVKRVTFFDTDGKGTFVPKGLLRDVQDSSRGEYDSMWMYPFFETQLRLGHCFAKDGATTHPEDIEAAIQIREEDLAHDRAA
jgi:hypothetical protein